MRGQIYNSFRYILGTPSSDNGDGTENVIGRVNSCSFKLYHVFSNVLKLWKYVGEFPRTASKLKNWKKNLSLCDYLLSKTSNQQISRGSRAVTTKKCTRKCNARAELLFYSLHKLLSNFSDLKIRGRRGKRKLHLKIEFAFFQSSSRSFRLTHLSKHSLTWIPENHIQDKNERKFRPGLFKSSRKRRETRHFRVVVVAVLRWKSSLQNVPCKAQMSPYGNWSFRYKPKQ